MFPPGSRLCAPRRGAFGAINLLFKYVIAGLLSCEDVPRTETSGVRSFHSESGPCPGSKKIFELPA